MAGRRLPEIRARGAASLRGGRPPASNPFAKSSPFFGSRRGLGSHDPHATNAITIENCLVFGAGLGLSVRCDSATERRCDAFVNGSRTASFWRIRRALLEREDSPPTRNHPRRRRARSSMLGAAKSKSERTELGLVLRSRAAKRACSTWCEELRRRNVKLRSERASAPSTHHRGLITRSPRPSPWGTSGASIRCAAKRTVRAPIDEVAVLNVSRVIELRIGGDEKVRRARQNMLPPSQSAVPT